MYRILNFDILKSEFLPKYVVDAGEYHCSVIIKIYLYKPKIPYELRISIKVQNWPRTTFSALAF